jgi:transcriptional regulator with XRE-family HTH domain
VPATTLNPDRRSTSAVGQLLRNWRDARGMSQLDLAMRAGFSARHVSFIENGRTQPSRDALLALAETLDVPLRERNQLLEAAGYAHLYRHTPLAADEMAHVRGVLQFILERHEPYGAVVLDRYSNCLLGNATSSRLIGALVDPSLMTEQANLLRLVFHPLGIRRCVVNWEEVARHLFARAQRDLGWLAGDGTAATLLQELREWAGPAVQRPPAPTALRPADLLLPVHIRKDGQELRLFSTIMTLGTPQDVTLQELRIETFFPADRSSETTFATMARAGG